MNRHFSGKMDLKDQFDIIENEENNRNKYASDLIENELDLKPIISKKKKKTKIIRFSLLDVKN